jgi:hypothetical protein
VLLGIVRRTLSLPSGRSLLAGEPTRSGAASRAAGAGSGSAPSLPASRLVQAASFFFAILIALLWALHPLQTQTS